MSFKKNRNRPIDIGMNTDKNHVYIEMDLQTDTCNPTRAFWLKVNNQEEAQMMSERLNEILERWQTEIAKDCLSHLDFGDWGRLKKILSGWSTKKEAWIKFPETGTTIK